MSLNTHAVIILPGLGDQVAWHKFLTKDWSKYGFDPFIFSMNWNNTESFEVKKDKILNLLNQLNNNYEQVSILGTSAGGSAAFNILASYPDKVYKAVDVCGRLRFGLHPGLLGYLNSRWTSLSFKESVELFSNNEVDLPPSLRQRMMTIRPKFGDELIPAKTIILNGSTNISVPTAGHIFSIAMSLKFFDSIIFEFLNLLH